MAANENEEFEFRLRAEREAAPPTTSAVGYHPPLDVPTDENLKILREQARKFSKETEGVTLPFGNNLIGDVEGIVGAGTGALGGMVSMFSPKAGSAVTYEPRTKTGKENLDLIHKIVDKTKIAGLGPAEGGMLAGRVGGLRPGVNVPEVKGLRAPPEVRRGASGEGAEAAVNELQRQSTMMESPRRGEGPMSARENAALEIDEATKPMREKAFASPVKVNMSEPLSLIERMKSQTNNPSVIKSLDQAKRIIDDGISKSRAAAPDSGRMTAAEYRALQSDRSAGTMPVKMLDETRQAINDIINGVGQGDKPYGAFAQKELMAVQESMMKYAPKEYLDYLTEYAKRAKAMDVFNAPGNVMGKVTADPAAFNLMNPSDKQNVLKKVFESDTPGRALSELVRDTEHSPEALGGVRTAYADWLTQADPLGGKPTPKGLTSRWQDTREAVKSSKLMTDEHIAAMDAIMDDVRAHANSTVKKAWASTGGFLIGQSVGHPIVGAHLARDIVMKSGKESISKSLDQAVMKLAATPEGARALAEPPTPPNIERVRLMLPTDVAAMVAPNEARLDQSRRPMRAKRLLSMTPMGF